MEDEVEGVRQMQILMPHLGGGAHASHDHVKQSSFGLCALLYTS
jgi:hypothetical protein